MRAKERLPRKRYSPEFKMKLVRLALEKEASVDALARQHDVNDNLLFKWIRLWQREGRVAEQEALNRALPEKLADREREIDHLQAQLDKLRRMNFGSRSEKVSRHIAQMEEADLNRLQKESDTLTGRVDDPAVQRPLRQTRTRKPFPESLPRDEKRLLPAASCCPECGGSLTARTEKASTRRPILRSSVVYCRRMRTPGLTNCTAMAG